MNGTIYKFEKDMLCGKSIYISEKQDNFWVQKHWHNYYEIVYFKKSSGACSLNSETYSISDNCVFLLTPKDFHEINTDEKFDNYSLIISFNEHMVDKHVLNALVKGPFVSYNISSKLSDKIDELYEVFGSNKKHRDLILKFLFNQILLEIIDSANEISSVGNDISPIVRESISVMLSAPTEDFSLSYFSKKFRVTEAYFSRLFCRQVGITFKQYLTTLRLEYAKQLLEENILPIIDVGYECGFNTPSQFFRVFKKAYGIPPSKFRQQKRNVTK